MVKVVLFSDLFGSFANKGGSWERCVESYRRLTDAGVEVVFLSGASLEVCQEILSGLEPAPAFIAVDGKSVFAPVNHPLHIDASAQGKSELDLEGQHAAALWAIEKFREQHRILITFGIGDSADDDFLRAVEVAALIPDSEGKICEFVPRPEVTYECAGSGQDGWNEWAELILKRVDIFSAKD